MSLTLVWVGPVTIRSPSARERLAGPMAGERRLEVDPGVPGARRAVPVDDARRRRRCRRRSRRCRESRRRPVRLVQRERGGDRGLLVRPAGAERRAPAPLRPRVTVASPPQPTSTQGGAARAVPRARTGRASSASWRPTSLRLALELGGDDVGGRARRRCASAAIASQAPCAVDQHHGVRLGLERAGSARRRSPGARGCSRGSSSQSPRSWRIASASSTRGGVLDRRVRDRVEHVAGDVGDGQVHQASRRDAARPGARP